MAPTPGSATTCGGTNIGQRPSISDRFSFSLQRELWARTILDASYLMNFIGRDGYTKNINMMDPAPELQVQRRAAGDRAESVLQLRNGRDVPRCAAHTIDRRGRRAAQTVSAVSQHDAGMDERAEVEISHARAARAAAVLQRHVGARGLRVRARHRGRSSTTTSTNTTRRGRGPMCPIRATALTYRWSGMCPSAAISAFGRGLHSALNAIVGGWELAGNYRYESGQYLRFGGMIAPDETPKTLGDVGAGNFWFDTTGFAHCRRSRAGRTLAVRRPQGTELQEHRSRAGETRAAHEARRG